MEIVKNSSLKEKVLSIDGIETFGSMAEENSEDYLPLSGGTLTGKLIMSSSGWETSHANGFIYDQYGNMMHKSTVADNNWHIDSNNGTAQFKVYPETGVVLAGKSLQIPKNGSAGYGLCNSDGASIIRDHNNQNVTVDATGKTLFLGYQNTTGINIGANIITDVTIDHGNSSNHYLYIGNTSNKNLNEVRTRNNTLDIGVGVDTGGTFRIWNYTHSKEIIRTTAAGVNSFNGNAATATKATQDGNGNNIVNTYAKNTDIFFQKNETWTINEWYGGGFLTTSTTKINFTIPLPKRKGATSSVAITGGKVAIRSATGTYLESDLAMTDAKVSVQFYRDGYITIRILNSTAYSTTNNTPVGVAVDNLTLKFT